MKGFSILTIVLFSINAFAMRPNTDDTSILNECLWNKELLSTEVDCNDMYNHYLPEDQKNGAKSNTDVRMGSYNIFRMSEQRFNKRLDYIAQIANSEWDVVALSELQPNRGDILKFNVNARMARQEGKISPEQYRKAYWLPTYVELLQELQKLDPSWGMIISPYYYGYDTELFGFLYRSSVVNPTESQYCKDRYITNNPFSGPFVYREIDAKGYGHGGFYFKDGEEPVNDRDYIKPDKALACPLALGGTSRDFFSKIPLMARFKAHNFEFNYITLHLRFRALGAKDGECVEACQKNSEAIIAEIEPLYDSKEELSSFRDAIYDDHGKVSDDGSMAVFRYFETLATVNEVTAIREAENDKDVIIAGDFNLELKKEGDWSRVLWDRVLSSVPGAQPLVTEDTSLSEVHGYGNNYDHFILVGQNGFTDECDLSSAKRLDILSPEFELANDFPLAKELADYKEASELDDIYAHFEGILEDRAWVTRKAEFIDHGTLMGMDLADLPSELTEKQDICTPGHENESVEMNFVNAQSASLGCNVLHFRKPYRSYSFSLSDHVPISMTCSTAKAE